MRFQEITMTMTTHAARMPVVPSNVDVMVTAAQWPWFVTAVHKAVAAFRDEWKWRRTLRELQELDDRMLADVGLTRGQVGYPERDGPVSAFAYELADPVRDSAAWRRYWDSGRPIYR
jgi:uncharacterized protein YjiS (DUF1127 family)